MLLLHFYFFNNLAFSECLKCPIMPHSSFRLRSVQFCMPLFVNSLKFPSYSPDLCFADLMVQVLVMFSCGFIVMLDYTPRRSLGSEQFGTQDCFGIVCEFRDV